jgi:hypothetical protein
LQNIIFLPPWCACFQEVLEKIGDGFFSRIE